MKPWANACPLLSASHTLVTFLRDRCEIEMHNTYHFSAKQVFCIVLSHQTVPEKQINCKMLNSASISLSLKENWSDTVEILCSLACLILCWNQNGKQLRSFLHWDVPSFINHEKTEEQLKRTSAKLGPRALSLARSVPKLKSIGS